MPRFVCFISRSINILTAIRLLDSFAVTAFEVVDVDPPIDEVVELENLPDLVEHVSLNLSVEDFDSITQNNWFMPKQYREFDIAKFVLDQCTHDTELQRAGKELLMYDERGLLPLLQYMKYLVDVMRKHNLVWGVGRGSSVASFVLFLIGIHRINSLYYDLDIEEFLK